VDIPSKILNKAIEQLASLPSVGKRSALRLALDLLKRSPEEVKAFSDAINELKQNIQYCRSCGNISDFEICEICANPNRDHTTICVVEDIRDVMAIESTGSFKGIYHVLGNVISPMDGVGPEDLNLAPLLTKAQEGKVKEIIFALSATMEGDTTNFYLFKKLKDFQVTVSTLSRGVAVGSELHYADELTLGRSITQRLPYEESFRN
jgi:recombination protein RecR